MQFLTCYDMIKKKENKYDLIISDQWIYQHALSILHDQDIRKYLDALFRLDQTVDQLFSQRYHIIVCDISIKNIIERLSGRKNGQSVLDNLTVDRMQQVCEKQIYNLTYYSNFNVPCYHIDFNGTEYECSNNLLNMINTIARKNND